MWLVMSHCIPALAVPWPQRRGRPCTPSPLSCLKDHAAGKVQKPQSRYFDFVFNELHQCYSSRVVAVPGEDLPEQMRCQQALGTYRGGEQDIRQSLPSLRVWGEAWGGEDKGADPSLCLLTGTLRADPSGVQDQPHFRQVTYRHCRWGNAEFLGIFRLLRL